MVNRFHLWYLSCLGLAGLAAFALMLWITPFGSGVSPDSTTYLGAAESLLSGNGFSIDGSAITHYPPLYPLVLAAASLFTQDPVQASRFLNAILFGLNVALVGLAAYRAARRSLLAGAGAAVYFLSSSPLLVLHSWAWSEPLFVSFVLAGLILLSILATRPSWPLLMASALCLGGAMLTRYVGIAFLPAACLIVFLGGTGRPFPRRVRDTATWLAVACGPLGLVLLRNMMLTGSATHRSLVYHPLAVSQYLSIVSSAISNFVAPVSLQIDVRAAVLGLLAAFLVVELVVLFRRHGGEMDWHSPGLTIPAACLFFSLSYLAGLWLSISFVDAAMPIDARLLSPVLALLIVGAFSGLWGLSQALKQPLVWWSFLALAALSIYCKIPQAVRNATAIQASGLGYTSRQWEGSESVAFIRQLPVEVRVYSNGAEALRFLTAQRAQAIPAKVLTTTTEPNENYNQDLKAMCEDIERNGAVLVYFSLIDRSQYMPSEQDLTIACQLPVLQRLADGTVYGAQ